MTARDQIGRIASPNKMVFLVWQVLLSTMLTPLIFCHALAQSNESDITKFESDEARQAGVLVACEFDITQMLEDSIRDKDVNGLQTVLASTSFVFTKTDNGGYAWAVVMSPKDASVINRQIHPTPFAPSFGYFQTEQGFSSISVQATPKACGSQSLCFGGRQRGFAELFGGLVNSKFINLSYQRKVGGLDTSYTVNLPRPGQKGYKALADFDRCFINLFQF
jgi:hypothetical protein